jgi:DNA-binding transcriptional regulator YhcF (GntR family)
MIHIDEKSITPKYLQISNAVIEAIAKGNLTKNQFLPSINELSTDLEIARDTVEKAYRHLKQIGIIGSIPGKGFYILDKPIKERLKIILIFNKLSVHKKIIFDEFVKAIGDDAAIDFYIYNNDFALFKKIIESKNEGYTHYIIIPHFIDNRSKVADLINDNSNGRLILLDKELRGITKEYGAVTEQFKEDIILALTEALPHLSKYNTLKIVFPPYSYFPDAILDGFQSFCIEFAFNYKIIPSVVEEKINKGEVYINLMEDDLIDLLSKIKESNLKVGSEIGIISYNETPWKQFILNGITTISTDFIKMGRMAAEMVLTNSTDKLQVPFTLTLRDSL